MKIVNNTPPPPYTGAQKSYFPQDLKVGIRRANENIMLDLIIADPN